MRAFFIESRAGRRPTEAGAALRAVESNWEHETGMKYLDIQGANVPALGLGTWRLNGRDCVEAVLHSLDIGYRHIDTAEAYENEAEVGRAIRESSVDREDVFVTTKVWFDHLERDDLLAAAESSLRRLGTDYIDLLLIHWPNEDVPLRVTIGAMLELKAAGKIRHIGVSNFPPPLVKSALTVSPILCNQVEYHPYLGREPLLALARENDHMLTAYCPLARGKVMEEDTLQEIAAAHGKSPAQVTLRWHIQQPHVAAVPKAANAEHRESNIDIFDFELSEEETRRISALDRGEHLINPDFGPEWKT